MKLQLRRYWVNLIVTQQRSTGSKGPKSLTATTISHLLEIALSRHRVDWSFLSLGRHLLDSGLNEESEKEFWRAARLFYEGRQFQDVLDILHLLLQKNDKAWDSADGKIFLGAINALPHWIPRTEVIKYAILWTDFHPSWSLTWKVMTLPNYSLNVKRSSDQRSSLQSAETTIVMNSLVSFPWLTMTSTFQKATIMKLVELPCLPVNMWLLMCPWLLSWIIPRKLITWTVLCGWLTYGMRTMGISAVYSHARHWCCSQNCSNHQICYLLTWN